MDRIRGQNFKRHASLGFLAAAVFPLPIQYLEDITLPDGIDPSGKIANTFKPPKRDVVLIIWAMCRMGRIPRLNCIVPCSICLGMYIPMSSALLLIPRGQLIDEMARCGCLGTVWGINGGATVGGAPLSTFGNECQKRKYLAPLLRGEQRHCLMVTEPDGKSHPPPPPWPLLLC